MAQLTIDVQFRQVNYEPDGEACEACGQPIYLSGTKSQVKVIAFGQSWEDVNLHLCQSCSDVILANKDV